MGALLVDDQQEERDTTHLYSSSPPSVGTYRRKFNYRQTYFQTTVTNQQVSEAFSAALARFQPRQKGKRNKGVGS